MEDSFLAVIGEYVCTCRCENGKLVCETKNRERQRIKITSEDALKQILAGRLACLILSMKPKR